MRRFDAIVLGGGFYGCCIAIHLSQYYDHVALIEKENRILQRASSLNQARVHGGYHYPRSFMTATRSLFNYAQFMHDFQGAIVDNIEHIYAIAKYGSKTNVKQFYNMFKRIGAPIQHAPDILAQKLFNPDLIEDAFIANESIYDCSILEKQLWDKLKIAGVKIFLNSEIQAVRPFNNHLVAHNTAGEAYFASQIFSCLYSNLNKLQSNSGLSLLPLKYQLAEVPLVEPPSILKKRAITIMDGPFFTMLPYPQKNLHTFGHVRYTNHTSWIDPHHLSNGNSQQSTSNFIYMKHDAIRYMPPLRELKYVNSLYEVRTILQRNENDDGRPIFFREEPTLPNFYAVMGSKIDNIYDVLDVISDKCIIKNGAAL